MVDCFAGKGGNLQAGDRGHVQNGSGPFLEHSLVENGIGHIHISIDVGVVHGRNLRMGKVVEWIRSSERETGLILELTNHLGMS